MPITSNHSPDAWAVRAVRWPLAFAQVREDPRLDLEMLRLVPERPDVVMIASGGETAVCLGRRPLNSLTLVDMNPAQLALCQVKWHLAQHATAEERLAFLGHAPMDSGYRREQMGAMLAKLGLPKDSFGPPEQVAALGADHCGRYEVLFTELRSALGKSPDTALATVMSLPNLVSLFGNEATRNPQQPFHLHFAERIHHALSMPGAEENPFLWQMLEGRFPEDHPYDWFTSREPMQVQPAFVCGRMRDTLDVMKPDSVDLVHLSNILDWLSPSDAETCLRSAVRVLRENGRVIIRQLNSTLDIPALTSDLTWDEAFGRELQSRDRSFFYPAIHVGQK